jgi:hypothetical protein
VDTDGYKRNIYGKTEKTGEGFVTRQVTFIEMSMGDDENNNWK